MDQAISNIENKREDKSKLYLLLIGVLIVIILFLIFIIVIFALNYSQNQNKVAPKIGQCEYNNRVYEGGESFEASDGCNTCTCLGDTGDVMCTEMACINSVPDKN